LWNDTLGSARLVRTAVSWSAVGVASSGSGTPNTTGAIAGEAVGTGATEVTPTAAAPTIAAAATPMVRVFRLTSVLSIGPTPTQR
jgi:hypothetical protein